jgi:hypothetical protein
MFKGPLLRHCDIQSLKWRQPLSLLLDKPARLEDAHWILALYRVGLLCLWNLYVNFSFKFPIGFFVYHPVSVTSIISLYIILSVQLGRYDEVELIELITIT